MNLEEKLYRYYRGERLSQSSINTYLNQFRKYERFCYSEGLTIEEMPFEGLLKFQSLATSESVNNQIRAMLNVLYFDLMSDNRADKLPYAKKKIKLPNSLTPIEVQNIFDVVKNNKQRLILKLTYYLGLRVSEVISIKKEDFLKEYDSGKTFVCLKVIGKGQKDRRISIPDFLLPDIRKYMINTKSNEYLFPGQFRKHYSVTSIRNVFNKAKKNWV